MSERKCPECGCEVIWDHDCEACDGSGVLMDSDENCEECGGSGYLDGYSECSECGHVDADEDFETAWNEAHPETGR